MSDGKLIALSSAIWLVGSAIVGIVWGFAAAGFTLVGIGICLIAIFVVAALAPEDQDPDSDPDYPDDPYTWEIK